MTDVVERVLEALNAWRTTVGDFVIEEETVAGRGEPKRHVAVYLIRDGLIARERLIG